MMIHLCSYVTRLQVCIYNIHTLIHSVGQGESFKLHIDYTYVCEITEVALYAHFK